MKRILIPLMLFAIAACSLEVDMIESPAELIQQEITITATSGEPDTRTERAVDGSVLWSPGDQISLFYGSGADGGSCFTAQNTETAKTVNFTGTIGVITGGNNIAVEDTYFWAVYPYNAAASCDGNSITTVLPAAQVATADTFADHLFPSMGRSQGLNMSFYNICGGIKFTVSEEDIKSVTLKANGGEQIVGTITASFDGGVPVVTNIANGSDTITLNAPAGETFEVGKAYFFVMVPTVFESGFTMTFSKGYARAERIINSKATIKRSIFGTMNTPDAGLEWEMLYVPIPDENFRAYMVQNFDTNGNGLLDFDEAEAVTSISVSTNSISSLAGIEECQNLTHLFCSGTVSFDGYEYIVSGQLNNLDISHNHSLTYLACSGNQLTSLDVTQNTALNYVFCRHNQLTSFDVTQNMNLMELSCDFNMLNSLDLSQNASLSYLACSGNQLTSLDITNNDSLLILQCYDNQIASLNCSNNTELSFLWCNNNQLTSLDLSFNKELSLLRCNGNLLTNLDLTHNTKLTQLDCANNNLLNLDVSNNTELSLLHCYSNLLTELLLINNTDLSELRCGSNQIVSLDLSHNKALTNLKCEDNYLEHLDLSYNNALLDLWCFNNHLTDLNVTQNASLVRLWCYNNQLNYIDITNNTDLSELRCGSNQIVSLDITNNKALTYLSCSHNQLTSLDVSKNTSLSSLYCSYMNDSEGDNLLGYLYIAQDQSIPNVTEDRSTNNIPAETIILVAPETGGNEGTIDEPLD